MKSFFIFKELTSVQSKSLMENKIPFITTSGQVFFPFLGLILFQKYDSAVKPSTEKMSPISQMLFLDLIYSKEEELKISTVSEKLGISKMSVSRDCSQLEGMKLIEKESRGRSLFIRPVVKGLELYKRAKELLINPVQESIYIKAEELPDCALVAGETSLGKRTMLNPPRVPEYAVFKDKVKDISFNPVEIRWSQTEGLVKLQLWKYDPELFLTEGEIDPVSLACSLSDIFDERVEGELEDLLEAFEW